MTDTNTKVYDPWEFSSGLVEEMTATIKDAVFATDATYNDGNTLLLKLDVMADDVEVGEGGAMTLLYPAGPGWVATDRGQHAAREDGKQKKLNKSTGVALLVASAVECGAGDILKSRGTPLDAGIWIGLKFDFTNRNFSFKGSDGTDVAYSRMLISAFHGSADTTGGPTPAATANGASSTPTSPAATNGGTPAADLDVRVKTKLKLLAKSIRAANGEHDTFVERAFAEVDGVNGDGAAEDAVMAYDDTSIWGLAGK